MILGVYNVKYVLIFSFADEFGIYYTKFKSQSPFVSSFMNCTMRVMVCWYIGVDPALHAIHCYPTCSQPTSPAGFSL